MSLIYYFLWKQWVMQSMGLLVKRHRNWLTGTLTGQMWDNRSIKIIITITPRTPMNWNTSKNEKFMNSWLGKKLIGQCCSSLRHQLIILKKIFKWKNACTLYRFYFTTTKEVIRTSFCLKEKYSLYTKDL